MGIQKKVTKTFKSDNSVAVRLPKALGIEAGVEVEIHKVDGCIEIRPRDRLVDISGFAGKTPWLKPLDPEDRVFEQSPRDWHGAQLKRDYAVGLPSRQ